MAFAQKYRIHGKVLFTKVFRDGKRVAGEYFLIRFIENQLDHVQIAIVAPVKIATKAVVRNRIKRRIVSLIQLNMLQKKNSDVIVTVLKDVSVTPGDVLQAELCRLFVGLP